MSIPQLTAEGWLPPGEHPCSLEDIERRFTGTERRRKIFAELRALLNSEFVQEYAVVVLVDGSFVSAKEEPGDADVVIGLRPGTMSRILDGTLGDGRGILYKLQGRLTERLPGVRNAVQAAVDDVDGPIFEQYHAYFQESTRKEEPSNKGILVLHT